MPGFLKTISDLLTYKEPKNKELGFELLEDEAVEKKNQQQNSSKQDAQQQNNTQQNSQQQNNTKKQNDTQQQNKAQDATSAGNAQNNNEQNQIQENAKKNENNQQQNKPQQNNQQQNNTVQQNEKSKSTKPPVSVENWNESRKNEKTANTCQPPNDPDTLSGELCSNIATIRQKFNAPKNQDIIIREFKIGRKIKAFMVYIDGMIDKNTLNLSIFPTLMSKEISEELEENCPVDYLMENVLSVGGLKKTNRFTDAINQVLGGVSALFIEGCSECILLETRGFEKRAIEKPLTEPVVKGSMEGFTENLRTNLTLIRRLIKNEKLITEIMTIGKMDNSNCAVLYLEGVANPKIVQEVMKRLKRIDADFVMGDGMIEQFIEDNSLMLFPQVLTTERPDRTASFIMEGQVVIIAEGTPFAITVPVTFFRLFHTSEDSNVRWPFSNFLRIIRLFGLFCATLLPGIYIAAVLYHPEMVPTELLMSMDRAKETVPFPTVVEVMLMEVAFELIREGGIRVPSVIGQTLGIVGALILGQAAVSAGLVSPVVVIVVSITALGNFAIPNYTLALAIRVERFLFIFAGALWGIYGVSLVIMLLAFLACSMKSFGEPFFAPTAPRTNLNPDVMVRFPIWAQNNRPDGLSTLKRKKQGKNVKVWISEDNNDKKGEGNK